MLAGIGIPLIANVVGKLFEGFHGENHDDNDRLRMFESLLPLIDRGEIDVSQSGNGLVINSRPTSGGAVIPALKYLLSGNKKEGSGLLLGPNSPFSQIPLLGALL